MQIVTRFFKDESGATAIEYGLIAALIAVVIIGAVTALGTGVSENMQTVADAI
jgi:pilus assembly protein Flp/PilA